MRYVLLYNPIAGRGRAVSVAGSVAARLRELGHEVHEARSERAGHIRELSRTLGASCERLLVLGGDGSLREAAWGLSELGRDDRPELGILAFGSGNVVARELRVPLDPVRAVDVIHASGSVSWDLGWARADGRGEEPFLAMLGLGYDAVVAERVGRARRSRWLSAWYRVHADSLYGIAGVIGVLLPGRARFRVAMDGVEVEPRGASVVLSNAETYAKGMAMSPGADPTDGVFDLHLRRSKAPWTTGMALALSFFRRRPPRWVARLTSGAGFRFDGLGEQPIPWQLDGDPMERAARVEVRLERAAQRLIGPGPNGPGLNGPDPNGPDPIGPDPIGPDPIGPGPIEPGRHPTGIRPLTEPGPGR